MHAFRSKSIPFLLLVFLTLIESHSGTIDETGALGLILDVDDTTITTGRSHACILQSDASAVVGGKVVCWGRNDLSQCDVPKDSMVQLSASADFTCGVTSRRTVKCWGAVPPRTSLAMQSWSEVLQVSSGDRGVCVIYGKAMLACAGDSPIETSPSGSFLQVSCGKASCCAITSQSHLSCWGSTAAIVQSVPKGGSFAQVSVGSSGNACAIAAAGGQLHCWGHFAGKGNVYIREDNVYVQVSVGDGGIAGIRTDGSLDLFGEEHRLWPLKDRQVSKEKPIIELSNYADNVCALVAESQSSASVTCWDEHGTIIFPPPVKPLLF